MPDPHHSPKCVPYPSFRSSVSLAFTHFAKPWLSSSGVIQREREPAVTVIASSSAMCMIALVPSIFSVTTISRCSRGIFGNASNGIIRFYPS